MSNRVDLLSARNLIVLAAGVFILSMVTSSLSALRPNDSNGWGRDTYGTRDDGYRAAYELLAELGVHVQRDLAPPQADVPIDRTLALWGPVPRLVRANPTYLQSLLAWVDRGGRLVVAPEAERASTTFDQHPGTKSVGPRNVLEALGLDSQFKLVEPNSTPTGEESLLADERPQPAIVPVQAVAGAEGMKSLAEEVRRLAIPVSECASLEAISPAAVEALAYKDNSGNEHWIAASVRRGKGEIVVVAEPAIFGNRYLAEADNSVLAARLLSPHGEEVSFDEFYHGLSVRGNPFYLLTRPGFAAVTVGILLAIGAWTWRAAMFLGPPMAQVEPPRRNIGEYVNAMGRFFSRSSDSATFLLRETRDGVLREQCRALRLPLETPDAAAVVAALERRDPSRAGRLQLALAEAAAALGERPGGRGSSHYISTIQRLTNCLSSSISARSAKNFSK